MCCTFQSRLNNTGNGGFRVVGMMIVNSASFTLYIIHWFKFHSQVASVLVSDWPTASPLVGK